MAAVVDCAAEFEGDVRQGAHVEGRDWSAWADVVAEDLPLMQHRS